MNVDSSSSALDGPVTSNEEDEILHERASLCVPLRPSLSHGETKNAAISVFECDCDCCVMILIELV